MQIEPNPVELARALNALGVRWVLIGGMAMVAHGANYLTNYCDVAFATDAENEELLCQALRQLDARLSRGGGLVDHTMLAAPFLHLNSEAGPLDIIRRPTGIDSFDGLFERSVLVTVDGVVFRIASLDDLIAMKTDTHRDKDKLHLIELKALKNRLE